MSPTEIISLIDIAQKLAAVINSEVQASDSAEVQAAWNSAAAMYQTGLTSLENSDKSQS